MANLQILIDVTGPKTPSTFLTETDSNVPKGSTYYRVKTFSLPVYRTASVFVGFYC